MLGDTCMVRLPAWLFKLETAVPRCCECGFLAVRNVEDSTIYPAAEPTRRGERLPLREFDGSREPHLGVSVIHRSDTILCYLGRPELHCPAPGRDFTPFILAEHDCPEFRRWVPGKTPKEHEDMSIVERVQAEHARAELQAQRARDSERTEDRKERESARKEAERHNRITRRVAVGSLIVACAVGAATLWKTFTEREAVTVPDAPAPVKAP